MLNTHVLTIDKRFLEPGRANVD